MKTILSITLACLTTVIWAQSSDQNYIKTAIYKQAVTAPAANSANARIEINYFDGLGRPIENIKYAQAPNGGDIITHIEYDDYGRQTKDYLPFVRQTASLDFEGLNESDIIGFYNNQSISIPQTNVPFSEKELENSPLNRVLKQAAPGEDWALGTGHEIKYDYQTNQAYEVRLFEVSPITYDATTDIFEPNLSGTTGGFYQAQSLFKNITIDENNSATRAAGNQPTQTIAYKTKTGQTVLKRISTAQGYFDTYYVYDDFGNLTYVIPPKAATQTHITQTILDDLCYQYKYDKRNRMVAKKIPGKQWEYMIYDKLDRLRATGPVASPFSNLHDQGWLFTKYDAFDRPVMTIWVADNHINATSRFTIQNTVNNATSLNEERTGVNSQIDQIQNNYTNDSYPTTGHILSINYYDDYDYVNGPTVPAQILSQPVKTHVKTLSTGTWERILESTTDYNGKLSYTLYKDDHLNAPIYVETQYPDGGYLITESEVDFEGKVLHTISRHKKDQNSFELKTEELFTYSSEGRLIQHRHRIGNEPYENIATNTYDLLGQVKEKKVGREAGNPLQYVDYTYNIRGWLTDINDINLTHGDLFYFHLGYTDGAHPLYNGNISQTKWKTAGDNTRRSYQYQYDGLNRLTEADYLNVDNNIHDTYNAYISYDLNGNITGLDRNGGFEDPMQAPAIDRLKYFYKPDSNQLQKVTDLTNDHQGFKDDGNGTLAGDPDDDYDYDAYGNMTKDQNKGITHIKYNHMNLPVEIDFVNNRKISYLYTAMGTKLQKTVDYNTYQVITDYRDGYQYETKPQTNSGRGYAELLFFQTAEGYVKALYKDDPSDHVPAAYQYVYIYKDHLGNNRLSYTLDPQTHQIKILEENHYYPFGLKHGTYNAIRKDVKYKEQAASKKEIKQVVPEAVKFKYYYQEQERQDELGLNWDSFKYRNYDYAIGRFMSVDPLAEKYAYNGVYNFSENRVLDGRELEGLEWEDIDGNVLTEEQRSKVKVYIFYSAGDGGFRDQAHDQYKHFTEKYGKGSVALSTGDTEESFLQDWKDMSGNDIQEVWLDFHGDSQWIGLSDDDGDLSSVGDKTAELGNDALDINKLPFPSGNISDAHLQINSCHSNQSVDNGLNVVDAFRKRFQSSNEGFKSISGASSGVSYPFGGARPFGYFSFTTYYRPTLENLIKEEYGGSSINFMLQHGLDPR